MRESGSTIPTQADMDAFYREYPPIEEPMPQAPVQTAAEYAPNQLRPDQAAVTPSAKGVAEKDDPFPYLRPLEGGPQPHPSVISSYGSNQRGQEPPVAGGSEELRTTYLPVLPSLKENELSVSGSRVPEQRTSERLAIVGAPAPLKHDVSVTVPQERDKPAVEASTLSVPLTKETHMSDQSQNEQSVLPLDASDRQAQVVAAAEASRDPIEVLRDAVETGGFALYGVIEFGMSPGGGKYYRHDQSGVLAKVRDSRLKDNEVEVLFGQTRQQTSEAATALVKQGIDEVVQIAALVQKVSRPTGEKKIVTDEVTKQGVFGSKVMRTEREVDVEEIVEVPIMFSEFQRTSDPRYAKQRAVCVSYEALEGPQPREDRVPSQTGRFGMPVHSVLVLPEDLAEELKSVLMTSPELARKMLDLAVPQKLGASPEDWAKVRPLYKKWAERRIAERTESKMRFIVDGKVEDIPVKAAA